MTVSAQCAPSLYNPNQEFHGLFEFYNAVTYICKTFKNQLEKRSVIGLPEITFVNMAGNCHNHASFSIENFFLMKF